MIMQFWPGKKKNHLISQAHQFGMQHLSLNETHSGIIGLDPPVTVFEKNER